jgi:hypothetical protein
MSQLDSFTYDNLVAGDFPIATEDVLVAAGQNLSRGAIVGRVKVSVPTTGTADGSNTGNGTVTAVTGGKRTKRGTYTIECKVAITNGGTFEVTDPDDKYVGQVVITAGAGGTGVFKSDELNFTVTDGSTDFALADKFTVLATDGVPANGTADGGNTGNGTVTLVEGRRGLKIGDYTITCTAAVTNGGVFKVTDPDGVDIQTGITIPPGAGNSIAFDNDQIAGTITDGSTDFAAADFFTVAVTIDPRQVTLLDKTAGDGSSLIYGILAQDTNATAAAKRSVVYRTGQFNQRQLTLASGTDIEDVRADGEAQSIFFDGSVSVDGNVN